ncbi:MAG: hypothetical protein M0Q54_07730 [Pigmentiphaga sp.]|nr:hypothetical protein [Pigmentiphaga sp.]
MVPEARLLNALPRDYQAMLAAQMLYGDPPAFTEIVQRLSILQDRINQQATAGETPT